MTKIGVFVRGQVRRALPHGAHPEHLLEPLTAMTAAHEVRGSDECYEAAMVGRVGKRGAHDFDQAALTHGCEANLATPDFKVEATVFTAKAWHSLPPPMAFTCGVACDRSED